MWNLSECPACGILHDDGAFIKDNNGKQYFICFDCSDDYSTETIFKIIKKRKSNKVRVKHGS